MKLFSKVKSVKDVNKIFFDNYDSANISYFPDVVEEGLNSLNNLEGVALNDFIKYCGSIDNYFGNGEDAITIQDKLKTVLTTSILLDKHYQEIEKLTEEEFLTLAYFLTAEVPSLIDNSISSFLSSGTKTVIRTSAAYSLSNIEISFCAKRYCNFPIPL